MAKTEKPFDAVGLMRRLREEIDREVENMSADQRRDYIRRRAERVRSELGFSRAPMQPGEVVHTH
jgi:hypothetical protein